MADRKPAPKPRPQTIDDYTAALPEPGRALVAEVRALAGAVVPDAAEAIKWGNPAWVHPSGTILFALGAFARHANLVFTPSTREAFDAELAEFTTGKGSVKLPYGDPVPAELLRRMMEYRVREHEVDGVLWR